VKVLILGCGPAGLIAAQAADAAGASVMILSKPRKSFMKGAQYLHRPIPGTNPGRSFEVNYLLTGTSLAYKLKVYGPKWDGTVSPEDLEETHPGWDIRVAYDQLWSKFGDSVTQWEATPSGLITSIDRLKPDLVVSTIPAQLLCSQGHTFRATRIWSGDQDVASLPDNTVICNGNETPRWYRAAKIQGWSTVEWPDGPKPPVTPLWEVLKPTDNNCDCFPKVVRSGRYGQWKKGVLSHETYPLVSKKIDSIRHERHL
jgi:hypothetical protein